MRILNIPEITIPATEARVPAPSAPQAPSLDPQRVDVLENVAKSVLEKIQALEERIRELEQMQKSPIPSPIPTPAPEPPAVAIPLAVVNVDSGAVKKNLMDKMWKYLNDERPPKTI